MIPWLDEAHRPAFPPTSRATRRPNGLLAAGGAREDWDVALRAWARERLSAGETDLHAQARERFDRALLEAALQVTGGRRAEAAERLGVGRNTVTRKLGPGRKRR